MDNNIENNEDIEKSEDLKKESNKSLWDKKRIIKLIIFIAIFIASLIFKNSLSSKTINLGDFGSIVPLLFNIISMTGFNWMPILAVVGIILVVVGKKVENLSNSYVVIISFIFVSSVILFFIS